jgi:hypothetical protein
MRVSCSRTLRLTETSCGVVTSTPAFRVESTTAEAVRGSEVIPFDPESIWAI